MIADKEQWHATTPRQPHDPVKVVLGVAAELGGCAPLWALALTAIYAVDPDRPSNPVDSTTPRYPATTTAAKTDRTSPPPPPTQQHQETP